MILIQLGGHRSTRISGFAKVDEQDSDLAIYQWRCQSTRNRYAIREGPDRKAIRMHRQILERIIGRPLASGEVTDHINGDVLDNRRKNLRVATASANAQNRHYFPENTSGHRGVSWRKSIRKWEASVGFRGKSIYCGCFHTSEAAARAAADKRRELGFAESAIEQLSQALREKGNGP